jgi:hypothetical protein
LHNLRRFYRLRVLSPPTGGVSAVVQQINGSLGSPSATGTIEGILLPASPPKFEDKIERKATKSRAYWPVCIAPPNGSLNVRPIIADNSRSETTRSAPVAPKNSGTLRDTGRGTTATFD